MLGFLAFFSAYVATYFLLYNKFGVSYFPSMGIAILVALAFQELVQYIF